MRSICFIFLLLLSVNTAMAVRAYPYPIKVKQPDGSTLTIVIHGDEFYRSITTEDGRAVVRGQDGYYRISGISQTSAAEAVLIRERNIRRLAENGGIPVLSPLATGNVKVLIIPVEFDDVTFSMADPQSHFHNMLNTAGYSENGGTGSAKDYFKANIHEKDFDFDVSEPVRLSKPYSHYGENDVSTPSVITYDIRIDEMVEEACSLADLSVDFSKYDNDGDGTVDYIFFFFAGYNEAESGDDLAIWPQTHNISSKGLRMDGVRIGLFSCASELSGSNSASDGTLTSGIGTFCHEFSHFLGLVDLYDTDQGSGGLSQGLWGTLSIMDKGNYNNYGRTPPYYCAIDRELAGSAKYMDVSTGTTVTLPPIHVNGDIIRIPTVKNGEYYLIENRTETGWDAYTGGSGMVIYHIDRSDAIVDGITASVRWSTNMVNTYAQHECADLVEAYPKAGHISQIFFPGQADITEFSAAGDPAFIAWDGTPVGIKFSNIAVRGDNVIFDISEDNTEILLTPTDCSIKTYQNKAIVEWSGGRPGTYRWGIIWGKKDEPELSHRDTSVISRFTFYNLSPKTDYSCMIYHIGEHSNGDTLSLDFSTGAMTSPFPYIVLDKNTYSTGDTLDLVINNLTEDINYCVWYINGNRAITDRYIFRRTGDYEIQAILEYTSDGSRETIKRKLRITDKDDDDNKQ